MAGRIKSLVAAGVVAIGSLVAAPARAQQFLPPNGNPGPFPPRACGHVGPCHCVRPWYPGYGRGPGWGPGWGYGWGYGYGPGRGYGGGYPRGGYGHPGGHGVRGGPR